MKIVLCNHAKNNKTNKYNGTNNNIVYNYNIIEVVFYIIIIVIIYVITLITNISIHEFVFYFTLSK